MIEKYSCICDTNMCWQGKYDEADPLYQRALAIDQSAYGPDHPQVATDLIYLGGLLKAQVSH